MLEIIERLDYFQKLLAEGKGEWGSKSSHYIQDDTWATWNDIVYELLHLKSTIEHSYRIYTIGKFTLYIRR